MEKVNKLGLHNIISEIKAGLIPAQISKKHNIPKQTLSYNVGKLIKMGCIENPSYGVWVVIKDVPNQPKDTLKVNSDFSKNDIRGHAFIWNIEFLEGGYNWGQVVTNYKKRYQKPSLSFKMICRGKVPRTIFKNRKIWLTKTGLTIYEPLDFFGNSAFKVKGDAVYEMDKLIKQFLEKFKLTKQFYRFKCSREHFAHIKNQMARQFNDKKQKIKVEFEGKYFWIDHSHGEHEEETNNPQVSVQAQKYYKSHVKTMFAFTPEVIGDLITKNAEGIKGNTDNFKEYAENIKSHIGAIKTLGAGVEKQNQIFERIALVLKKLESKK